MKVLIRNTFNHALCISCCQKLGYIVDIYYKNCFLANTRLSLHLAIFFLKPLPFFEYKPFCILIPTNLSIETRLDNRIKIYKNKYVVILLAQLVVEYRSILESKGFVYIQPKHCIKMLLKPRWEVKIYIIKPIVWSLRNKAH